MAQKKITLFRSGQNYGASFYDGNKKTSWEKLTKQEQEDLLGAMASMYELFLHFMKKNRSNHRARGGIRRFGRC